MLRSHIRPGQSDPAYDTVTEALQHFRDVPSAPPSIIFRHLNNPTYAYLNPRITDSRWPFGSPIFALLAQSVFVVNFIQAVARKIWAKNRVDIARITPNLKSRSVKSGTNSKHVRPPDNAVREYRPDVD